MQDQNATPKPTTLTLAVTVTLAGKQAAPVASILQTILASGVADLPLLDLLRAELGTVHVFRDGTEVESPDWRIVRAAVTVPDEVTP